MNLDDTKRFKELDSQDMIAAINELPDQLKQAWELGQQLDLPAYESIRQIVISGMGGSAIGGDLLANYGEPMLEVPVYVHRDYDLPAWAKGPETLVICSSHSGNTEETLSAFEMAEKNGCQILAVTTNGELAKRAKAGGAGLWIFEHKGQPRAAVGFSFGLLLAAVCRLGFLPDQSAEVAEAVAAMKAQQKNFLPDVPATSNPSKRMGGQFMGRWITVFGAGFLGVVARRWKTQLNEVAKSVATFEILPEADHNTLQGVMAPDEEFGASMVIFLESDHLHRRNQQRTEFTRMGIMLQGQNTDTIKASGTGRLAHMWTILHYGDYASYYLAMAYGVDPSPVPMIAELKERLDAAK
jgi:glucose/mannose-6-phosphate isomerase